MDNEKEIVVSVIIPIYNGEKYIENIYKNFQDFDKIEILLIDDGSTDKSWNVCKEIADVDDRFKVYHKENTGIADTRNYGLKKSNGKYCYFFDQDDHVVADGLKQMIKVLDESNAEFCIANSGVRVNGHKEEISIINESEIISDEKRERIAMVNRKRKVEL